MRAKELAKELVFTHGLYPKVGASPRGHFLNTDVHIVIKFSSYPVHTAQECP